VAKLKKKRASKYDSKLSVHGSFEDVIKASVAGNPVLAPKAIKPKKK
jgi:hypothetical protein